MKDFFLRIQYVLRHPKTLFWFCLYKPKYKKLKNKQGFFLVKRKFVWLLFLPVIISVKFIFLIIDEIGSLWDFDMHWIEHEPKKITIWESFYLVKRLK